MGRTRWPRLALALGAGAMLALTACDPPPLVGGPVVWLSADRQGTQERSPNMAVDLSRDGRWATLMASRDLGGNDTNLKRDVYVRNIHTGGLTLVSITPGGKAAGDHSEGGRISADGRFIAFSSRAWNLVPGDDNGAGDIFVRDMVTRTTTKITHAPDGGNAGSRSDRVLDISPDGRWILFRSSSDRLVPDAPLGNAGIGLFLADRTTGVISRMDLGVNGEAPTGIVADARVSDNGRFVSFNSGAGNLGPADSNGVHDVYWKDRQTGQVKIVSVDGFGLAARAVAMDMSGDGSLVSFSSYSPWIVNGDTNESQDVFVRNVAAGTVKRVSVNSAGTQADKGGFEAEMSDDGRRVAFSSSSTNLVPGELNGPTNVYVRDIPAGSTSAVIVGTDGKAPNGATTPATLSGDGSVLFFKSEASNLVAGVDGSAWQEVYAVTIRSAA